VMDVEKEGDEKRRRADVDPGSCLVGVSKTGRK